ncbi:MAG: helix-turn-helix domain-containing protein [Bdellovibrionales bacterium]
MKLSDYLEEKNMTYAAFARLLGMKSTSATMNVCRYVNGTRRPRPATANKIVKVTNGRVTLKDIYGEEDGE